MAYLSEWEYERLCDRLADLPRLAALTTEGAPGGSTLGSAAPPGVDLTAVDAGREQPKLLERITGCIRTVFEELPGVRRVELAERPTWRSETQWLIETGGSWQGDDWCAEWIATEVQAVRDALLAIIEQHNGWRTCAACGAPIVVSRTQTLAVAECSSCERICGMTHLPAADTKPIRYDEAVRRLALRANPAPKAA